MTTTNRTSDEQHGDAAWIARDGKERVKRRTIVQGAAWTIPIVAAASAAPLAAASVDPGEECQELRLDARVDSVAWNDYAGGTAAIDTFEGRHVFGPNQPMFVDVQATNTGEQVIAAFNTAFTVEINTANQTLVAASVLINGVWHSPTTATMVASPSPPAPQKWEWDFLWLGFTLPPGGKVTFRYEYRTANTSGANRALAIPHSAIQPGAYDCNGVLHSRTDLATQYQDSLGDNSGSVANPYFTTLP